MTSHPSCRRHVTKCQMLLTLSPSITLWRQTTIPTKECSSNDDKDDDLDNDKKVGEIDEVNVDNDSKDDGDDKSDEVEVDGDEDNVDLVPF